MDGLCVVWVLRAEQISHAHPPRRTRVRPPRPEHQQRRGYLVVDLQLRPQRRARQRRVRRRPRRQCRARIVQLVLGRRGRRVVPLRHRREGRVGRARRWRRPDDRRERWRRRFRIRHLDVLGPVLVHVCFVVVALRRPEFRLRRRCERVLPVLRLELRDAVFEVPDVFYRSLGPRRLASAIQWW
ncbi:hypothetical protein F4824DRAFT_478669 [Ustulina deusta]|nr:hypothetical protein F4824DRAFT_478669 [Ustulina deusta]